MRIRKIILAPLWLRNRRGFFVHAMTQEELVAKLQAAGYSNVGEIKSTAEGTAVKATKDGKEVRLVVDSSGQIKEQK